MYAFYLFIAQVGWPTAFALRVEEKDSQGEQLTIGWQCQRERGRRVEFWSVAHILSLYALQYELELNHNQNLLIADLF